MDDHRFYRVFGSISAHCVRDICLTERKLKTQITKPKHHTVSEAKNTKPYRDLEERTAEFAKRIIRLCQALPKNQINNPLISQIIRSAGSVGANYREANEGLGKKDFLYRLRIARKEAKETSYWLDLIEESNKSFRERMKPLFQEVIELRNILSSIITKAT
jgi:four helix bundle protein